MKLLILAAFFSLAAQAFNTSPSMTMQEFCVSELSKDVDAIMSLRTELENDEYYTKSVSGNDDLVELLYSMKSWSEVRKFKQILMDTCYERMGSNG